MVAAWMEKCSARGNGDADRHCGAPGPGRQPVPCGPHPDNDSGNHQQESEDRRSGLVAGVGDVNAHRGSGQAEGNEGECLHGVRHRGCHVRHCDRKPIAKSSPNHERALRFE
jgi:hypothetical protein